MTSTRKNIDESRLTFEQRLQLKMIEANAFRSVYYIITSVTDLAELMKKITPQISDSRFELDEDMMLLDHEKLYVSSSTLDPSLKNNDFDDYLEQGKHNAMRIGGKIQMRVVENGYELEQESKEKYLKARKLYDIMYGLIECYYNTKKDKDSANLKLISKLLEKVFGHMNNQDLNEDAKLKQIFSEMDKVFDLKKDRYFSALSLPGKKRTGRGFEDAILFDKSFSIIRRMLDIKEYQTHRTELKVEHIKKLSSEIPTRPDKSRPDQSSLPSALKNKNAHLSKLVSNGLDQTILMKYISSRFSPSFDTTSEAFMIGLGIRYYEYIDECSKKSKEFQEFWSMLTNINKLPQAEAKQYIDKINSIMQSELELVQKKNDYNGWSTLKDKEKEIGYMYSRIDGGEKAAVIRDEIAKKVLDQVSYLHTNYILSIIESLKDPEKKPSDSSLKQSIKLQNENIIEPYTFISSIFAAIKECLLNNNKWPPDWNNNMKDCLNNISNNQELIALLVDNKIISESGIEALIKGIDQYNQITSDLDKLSASLGYKDTADLLDKEYGFYYTSGLNQNALRANDKLVNTVMYYTASYILSTEFKDFKPDKSDADIQQKHVELSSLQKQVQKAAKKAKPGASDQGDDTVAELSPANQLARQLKSISISYKDLDKSRHIGDINHLLEEVDKIILTDTSDEEKFHRIVSVIEMAYIKEQRTYTHPFLSKDKSNEDFVDSINSKENTLHYPRMLGLMLQNAYKINPDYESSSKHIMDRKSIKNINLPFSRVYEKLFPQLIPASKLYDSPTGR